MGTKWIMSERLEARIGGLYDRDKKLIELLLMNARGEYSRFSQGDAEYLIETIIECARLEKIHK